MDNARAGDKGGGSRNKKKRTNAWGETKAVVAIHTSLQLHDPTPPLQIGTGNQMLEKLRDIINEYIESYAPGEESIRSSIPVLKQIITDTAKQRDEWDESDDGKNCKTLMKTVATYRKRREVMLASGEMLNNEQEITHKTNESTLKELNDFRNRMVHKLDKACNTLADQQLKLKAMRTNKVKG